MTSQIFIQEYRNCEPRKFEEVKRLVTFGKQKICFIMVLGKASIKNPSSFCHGQDPKDRPWPSVTLFLPWPRSEGSAMTISYPLFLLLVVLILVVVLGFQAWHEAKTSCHMHNTPRTPNIFTFSGPPMKWPLEGMIKGAPDPPDPPPLWGGQNIFKGVITDGPFRPR